MKKRSLLFLLAVPFLLVGCGKTNSKEPKAPFEVPLVDVTHLEINLPTMPTYDPAAACKKSGDNDVIDIFEISDMHAMIDFNTTKNYFGFSGLANYLAAKRSDNPGTILVSSGDMWQGGAESNLTRGRVVADTMRYVGFEAMALGNHEFDWGEEVLSRNSGYYSDYMPLLCANLIDKRTNQRPSFVGKSTVIQRGGYKIGVIGTIGSIESSIAKAMFANFEISNSSNVASEEANRLRSEENCDFVVWLSHEEASTTVNIPAGVDVFFGGHKHKDVNQSVTNSTLNHDVPILATLNYGQSIAHAQLVVNPSTKEVVSATGEIVSAETNKTYLSDESSVKSIIDQYKQATAEVKQYQLNNVSGTFRDVKELANLSCKAMFETYKDDQTLIALQNGDGGVRSSLESGMVTYGDIYTAFPFDNEIVTFELPGNQIRAFFEKGSVGQLNCYVALTKYSEIDTSKTYKVVTTDFVCTNKLNMSENDFTNVAGSVIRDVVAKYIYETNGLKAADFNMNKPNYQAPSK